MNDKVAIYIRLSVEDENKIDESESIKNQRLILTEYAENQGWELFRVYCDEDFSGLDSERPEFKKMLSDAKKGLFNIILCKSQSRFTRDMEVAEKYINRLFYLWNIRFISLTDNVDTFNKGGKKARQINSLINEWYCEDLSESVNAVFQSKMQRGEFIGSFAPYGYKKAENNKNKLEIDDEAKAVVKEIFDLYIQGYGFRKIAEVLTKRGVLPPTEYKRSKGESFFNPNYTRSMGGIWSAGSIRNILKNSVYIGNMVQGKTKKLSYKSKKITRVDKKGQIKVDNTHKAIIEEEIFYKVQKMMSKGIVKSKDSGVTSALRGRVFCGICGNACQRGSLNREKTGFYYRCPLKYKSRGEKCNNSGVLNLDIEKKVFERLKEMKREYIKENIKKNEPSLEVYKEKYRADKEKIEEFDNRLLVLYEDYSKGILDKEEFILLKGKLSEKKKEKERELITLEKNVKLKEISQGENKLFEENRLCFLLADSYVEKIVLEKPQENKRKIVISWKI